MTFKGVKLEGFSEEDAEDVRLLTNFILQIAQDVGGRSMCIVLLAATAALAKSSGASREEIEQVALEAIRLRYEQRGPGPEVH